MSIVSNNSTYRLPLSENPLIDISHKLVYNKDTVPNIV